MTTFMSIYEMQREHANLKGVGITDDCIKVGEFGEFIDLCYYYQKHYRPLLVQLAEEKPDTAARFIVQDFDTLFLGYLKELDED